MRVWQHDWGPGFVPVPGGSGRLRRVGRWGQKLQALAGVVVMKMANRKVWRDVGEKP